MDLPTLQALAVAPVRRGREQQHRASCELLDHGLPGGRRRVVGLVDEQVRAL